MILIEIKDFLKKNKFRLYFALLFTFLIIDPLPTPDIIDKTFAWVLVIIFFYCPFFMSGRISSFITASIFFLMLMTSQFLEDNAMWPLVRSVMFVFTLLFYFWVIIYLLWYTLREAVISDDLIFSGLIGFFMIGIGFAQIFDLFQHFGLMGYSTPAGALDMLNKEDLIYFSLSNMSSLGIGDITPTTVLAKRLTVMESCVGTLYVAVFIGRLVGLSAGMFNPKNRLPKDRIKRI